MKTDHHGSALISRRSLLAGAGALAASPLLSAAPSCIIDTHTHFYDPTRPQGTPWPSKEDKLLYRPVLPPEFKRITAPFAVTGTIEVEASPLLEDNQWVLDLAEKEPIIVGTVGDLEPGKSSFANHLERFHKNRRFRGIRLGNLWGRTLGPHLSEVSYVSNLKLLAQADLEIDAIGGPALLSELVRLTDLVPNVRIVIDHLPYDPPTNPAERTAYESALKELGHRPQVYAKVSNVVRRVGNAVPEDLQTYRSSLDELWEIFGPDRLVYGSNWPVSTRIAPYPIAFKIVREYFAGKGQEATEKYFCKNSKRAYKW